MFESHKKGLSVVMMGRNEESYLPRSIPPLAQLADEVIFVDTGSNDRSLDIVKTMGCRVFSLPWQDNFSTPKNHGIEQARYSWILNVDCDEVLQDFKATRAWIDSLPEEGPAPGYLIDIDNLLTDGSLHPMKALRLFRNDPHIRFDNPIHEGVADSIYRQWPNQPINRGEVRLLHYGYQAGVNREKLSRNMAILQKWVEEEPNHIYAAFKLGINLCHRGAGGRGLALLKRAFFLMDKEKDKKSYPFAQQLVQEYYKNLLQSGQESQAEAVKKRIASW
jgi:glycosyltransferase involved in cell wall biosynthesis